MTSDKNIKIELTTNIEWIIRFLSIGSLIGFVASLVNCMQPGHTPLDLIGLLLLAEQENILNDKRLILYAHQIRWIRNMVVHDRMPFFQDTGKKNLEMKVLKSRKKPVKYAKIKLNAEEVEDIKKSKGEITAYFCISRVREVLKNLLRENKTEKLKKEENYEDSSYLFRW